MWCDGGAPRDVWGVGSGELLKVRVWLVFWLYWFLVFGVRCFHCGCMGAVIHSII